MYATTLLSYKPSCKWPCHVSWMLVGINCTLIWLPFWLGAMQCFLWLRFLCDLSKVIRHCSSCMWHLWLKIIIKPIINMGIPSYIWHLPYSTMSIHYGFKPRLVSNSCILKFPIGIIQFPIFLVSTYVCLCNSWL
jgi:hypothetical protein